MTSESFEPDDEHEAELHREMDRLREAWDNEPTHEKWRRGRTWR
jgi:hypothetical protein